MNLSYSSFLYQWANLSLWDFSGCNNIICWFPGQIKNSSNGRITVSLIVYCFHVPPWLPLVFSPDIFKNVIIPKVYHESTEVFSKAKATGWPPHCLYSYTINHLPGISPPHNRIYPFSLTGQHAREEYIQEVLQQGYIWPATSPASTKIFFVENKGGGHRPCVYYCGHNQINVKYSYLLPLARSALEQLQDAKIFTKLSPLQCLHPGAYQWGGWMENSF